MFVKRHPRGMFSPGKHSSFSQKQSFSQLHDILRLKVDSIFISQFHDPRNHKALDLFVLICPGDAKTNTVHLLFFI